MEEVGVCGWGLGACVCVSMRGWGCRILEGGDSSYSKAEERGETVQDKDRCNRNALWAAVSNCSVLSNISCHDNGIFTEIDTQTGQFERKDHLKTCTALTVPTWVWHLSRHSFTFSPFHTQYTAQDRLENVLYSILLLPSQEGPSWKGNWDIRKVIIILIINNY